MKVKLKIKYNRKDIEERLTETLYQLLDIKGSVYALYQDGSYDEDYIDDIIEELDNATDAIRGAWTMM